MNNMYELGQYIALFVSNCDKFNGKVPAMKKLLYGTTALVAAGMVAGGAQAADKIKVGVGGYFYGYLVGVSQDDSAASSGVSADPGNNRRGHHINREGEIIFTGKTTLDNGIQFGVQVQLEAEQLSQ